MSSVHRILCSWSARTSRSSSTSGKKERRRSRSSVLHAGSSFIRRSSTCARGTRRDRWMSGGLTSTSAITGHNPHRFRCAERTASAALPGSMSYSCLVWTYVANRIRPPAPKLTGPALEAVRHRGSHVQIIAAAGSGKTEVVSQRVADLLADGVPAESIVAFTFTERAAAELKDRIAHRVEERLGARGARPARRPVRRHDPRVLLPPAAAARAAVRDLRRARRQPAHRVPVAGGDAGSSMRQLDPGNRLFASIAAFLKSVDVVENELLDPARCPSPFGTVLRDYYDDARALPAAHLRPADRARGARARAARRWPRRSTRRCAT